MNSTIWLDWAMRIQAIAQNGLAYSQNQFDIERYHQLRDLAAEILSSYSDHSFERLNRLFSGEQGYATPKLDVRGVVFQEGKILLVKELSDGAWTLPGGWIDIGEPPRIAVEREVLEESGFQVRAAKMLAVMGQRRYGSHAFFHTYKLFIGCDLIGGQAAASIETGGAEFFDRDQLPPLSHIRTTPEDVARMFFHFDHPDHPTDFD